VEPTSFFENSNNENQLTFAELNNEKTSDNKLLSLKLEKKDSKSLGQILFDKVQKNLEYENL
jgi:hypothetical protein